MLHHRICPWIFALALVAPVVLGACGDPNQSGRFRAEVLGARADIAAPREVFNAMLQESCSRADVALDSGVSDVRREPYLQQVMRDSALVLWTAASAEPYAIEVTDAAGRRVGTYRSELDASAHSQNAQQHVAKLTNLEPEQVYCYAITRGGQLVAGPFGFRTAPESASGTPVSFVAFGDSGYGGSDQLAVARALQGVPVDFVISTGDVAYDKGRLHELEANFFDVYSPMLSWVPVFPTLGNHDLETANGAPYLEAFALPDNGTTQAQERWYSFDWGQVHVVSLDRQRIGEEQARWLDDDLDRNRLPWIVAVTHQSPYSSGAHGSLRSFRTLLSPILERHGVQLVLAGHDHDYERTAPVNGVTYVVTGGGGRGVRSVGRSGFTAFSLDVLHFVYVRVEGNELRLYAIDATGQEFDFVRIVRPSTTRT